MNNNDSQGVIFGGMPLNDLNLSSTPSTGGNVNSNSAVPGTANQTVNPTPTVTPSASDGSQSVVTGNAAPVAEATSTATLGGIAVTPSSVVPSTPSGTASENNSQSPELLTFDLPSTTVESNVNAQNGTNGEVNSVVDTNIVVDNANEVVSGVNTTNLTSDVGNTGSDSISTGKYLGNMFLFLIPIVGQILLISL